MIVIHLKFVWNPLKSYWHNLKKTRLTHDSFDRNPLEFDWNPLKFDWNVLNFDRNSLKSVQNPVKSSWHSLKSNCHSLISAEIRMTSMKSNEFPGMPYIISLKSNWNPSVIIWKYPSNPTEIYRNPIKSDWNPLKSDWTKINKIFRNVFDFVNINVTKLVLK